MIDDLDTSLTELIKQEVSSLDETKIYFEAPDDKFAPTLPAVNLFLYDVRENLELRSKEWLVERHTNGTTTKKRLPVRVECSYLITAWAGDVNSEHKLLGEVMSALFRHPTIPPEILQGNLKGQNPSLPTITLQPGRLQSLGEFWQALGGKPKAALNFTVTIGVDAHKPVETGPPVTDKRIPGRKEEN